VQGSTQFDDVLFIYLIVHRIAQGSEIYNQFVRRFINEIKTAKLKPEKR